MRTLARMSWWARGFGSAPHATLLPHVVLYPGVQAGSHFFAHAHAVVRENCILGDHVTLENGAIIGADGFGFAKNELGTGRRFRNRVRCGSATASMSRPMQLH